MDRFKGFLKAKPVFIGDYDGKGNMQVGFCRLIRGLRKGDRVNAAVAAGTFYRLFINGRFSAHGPARAAEGYLRVDELDVSSYIADGDNFFAFEVCHYGFPFGGYSNDVAPVDGLLQAEITRPGKSGDVTEVLDATSADWKARVVDSRVRATERISHCRENTENYILKEGWSDWRTDPALCTAGTVELGDKYVLLRRGMALPSFAREGGARLTSFGAARTDVDKEVGDDWFSASIRDYLKNVPERPVLDYRRTEDLPAPASMLFTGTAGGGIDIKGIAPGETAYFQYDIGKPRVGFISLTAETAAPCVLDVVHLESMSLFDRKNEISGGANPVARLHLPAGRTEFVFFEPVLVRYLKFYVRPEAENGAAGVKPGTGTPWFSMNAPEIIDYSAPDNGNGSFLCSDEDVNRLYEAARLTLKLNTLDIFMDCPERERGGWLCDSLWTARAFRHMKGDCSVEKAFIENFLQTDAEKIWHGFFPECYPGTKPDFSACPGLLTWSFWLMLELCEYVRRSGDTEFAAEYAGRVDAFVRGSLELRGESGLLENTPWLFIDWSMSNEYCRPVSTAANALYALMLRRLGELYGNGSWKEIAAQIRSVLRETLAGSDVNPSDTGGFLDDGLGFSDGKLSKRGYYSESAQYTMIWSELFDRGEMPDYFWRIVHTTGADRDFECDTKLGKAGLFIGLGIRLDMLSKLGEYEKMLSEMKKIFMPQLSEGPGTLWETQDPLNTSRCHGFCAHAGVLLTRDILGLGEPDELTKTVRIAPHPCGLRWARGVVNTSDGLISLSWRNPRGERGDRTAVLTDMELSLPAGWKAVFPEE